MREGEKGRKEMRMEKGEMRKEGRKKKGKGEGKKGCGDELHIRLIFRATESFLSNSQGFPDKQVTHLKALGVHPGRERATGPAFALKEVRAGVHQVWC